MNTLAALRTTPPVSRRMSGYFFISFTLLLVSGCADAMLTQADVGDVDKLIKQHRSASAAQKREAAEWMRGAESSAKERRWDRAAKMYGEASLRFPTFQALKGYGESIVRSDRKRDSMTESLSAHKAAFDDGARSLRTAVTFAEKLPSTIDAKALQSVRDTVACLESYVVGATPTCEPVKSVLQRYAKK
jgi:hypothetical protein